VTENLQKLLERLTAREAVVSVVGMGYVGLPVAVAFAEAGFEVVGIDLDLEKVAGLSAGHSHGTDVEDDRLAPLVKSGRFTITDSFERTGDSDAVLICVPTPITNGAPDLGAVRASTEAIARYLKKGSLIVLESTTYPGTTQEILLPILETSGLTAGTDFFLAFSPERIDPGNERFPFEDIPKVVGGIDEDSTTAAETLYLQVLAKVFTVSSPREAELAKLIENTFRHVNIALVNELAVYAHEMGINIWESIEAAATKPFGYMAFWPSPGWGGHCIPLDPAYLSWRVRQDRSHEVRFVELAQAVNSEMPRHVVERISALLNEQGKAVRGSKILGIGMAYKGGTDDTRESPGVRILNAVAKRGAVISYHDPLVPELELGGAELDSADLASAVEEADLVVVFVPQTGIDWSVLDRAVKVFDCCNVLRGARSNVERL